MVDSWRLRWLGHVQRRHDGYGWNHQAERKTQREINGCGERGDEIGASEG